MGSMKKICCVLAQIFSLSYFQYKIAAVPIPSGYILDVTHECGVSETDNPVITIISDLYIEAKAKCANGDFKFTKISEAKYVLTGTNFVTGDGCVFFNRHGDHQVEVSVGWSGPGVDIVTDEKKYTISCTFANHGGIDMEDSQTEDGMVRPKELLINVGTEVPSTYISLELRDVKDKPITGSIPMDKHVTLVATTSGIYQNYQIRPVCCFAIGATNNVHYGILRSGCGDGVIFKKDEGFITDATSARSPYFTSFYVEKDESVTYQCSFIICEECSGSSCAKGDHSVITLR
ncbi:hypothetical protein LOTGIDRAFT_205367 [Lottia gigantea]|uniref:Vitelline envelope sperm lysin receptor C-terminal domain-containing protein n=1 Tax=Lottia gigantea TaxID=225164 RepID=V4AQW6_LOTGI|nr:hypothetical protein LOTGIDRAFT_205367 [Lottia gigantea]ESO97220.1 hypothetical protein LOTGIDRAFT_205367 [Lottia gigantea]